MDQALRRRLTRQLHLSEHGWALGSALGVGMTVSDAPKPAKSAGRRILELAGSAAGIAAGAYAGLNVVVPAIAGGVSLWLMKKTGFVKSKNLTAAIAFQAAHVTWMWVGAMVVAQGIGFFVEVGAYTLLLLVLVWRQAKWIAILLMAYQVVGLIINCLQIVEAPFASVESHALALHLMLRAGAFVAMVQFLREKPKEDFAAVF